MLLAIPIRTDAPVRRLPFVNYGLITANILMFLATSFAASLPEATDLRNIFALESHAPKWYQFISYQFMHADIWHILGNMVFLWVFGNAANSKMGHVPYLLFYLSGGAFAGAAFATLYDNPLVGASGSIAAVTTAYLVLFPQSEVAVFYWFWFYIGTWHVQALLIIGLKIILYDNLIAPRLFAGGGASEVAYAAHWAGYVYGFALSLIMLTLRALPRDQYDILALWKRSYQRAQMRHTMADPEAQVRAVYGRVARPVAAVMGRPVQAIEPEIPTEVTTLREEITDALNGGDYKLAVDKWETLVSRHPDQCLPRSQMLDVANQMVTMNRFPQAVAAYERYLKQYPQAPDRDQIRLMLGIIYARNLQQYEPAAAHLRESLTRLTQPQQRDAATQWLNVISAALNQSPPGTPA